MTIMRTILKVLQRDKTKAVSKQELKEEDPTSEKATELISKNCKNIINDEEPTS